MVAAAVDTAGTVVSSLSLFTPVVVELPFAETTEGADGERALVEAGATGGAIGAVMGAGVSAGAMEGA